MEHADDLAALQIVEFKEIMCINMHIIYVEIIVCCHKTHNT